MINQQLSTPAEQVVDSVTEFHSGVSRNVVPAQAVLGGTLRTASIKQREAAKQMISIMAQHLAQAHGATVETRFIDFVPPTINTQLEKRTGDGDSAASVRS